jgi:Flp pilus assembly protein TadG
MPIFSELRMKTRLLVESFRRGSEGNVGIFFAIATLPALLMVGASIDYGNGLRVRAKLQAALDSGALRAATDPSFLPGSSGPCSNLTSCGVLAEKSVKDGARAYFAQYQGLTPAVTTTLQQDGTITAKASVSVPTFIMKLTGATHMPIAVTTQVKRGLSGAEVVLVLDTTGSMSGAKIATLKTAANDLVATLLPNSGTTNKVAIAPFDQYVKLPLSYRNASWMTGAQDYSVPGPDYCYDSYPIATAGTPVHVTATCYNDGAPYDCSYDYTPYTYSGTPTRVCSPTSSSYTWYGCVGSRNYPLDLGDAVGGANPVPGMLNTSCAQTVTRLTNDKTAVQAQINAMSAYGETYIAPGLLWGWRLISPDGPFGDAKPYGATRKIMVLMTDGANTRSAIYPGHSGYNVADANTITSKTCDNIKAKGVEIYSVAFMITDTTILNILRNCATSPTTYYNSTSTSDLKAAFQAIGYQIMAVRLTK